MKRVTQFAITGAVLVLLAIALSWPSGNVAATAVSDTNTITQIIPNELETSTRIDNMHISDLTGAPVVLYRMNYSVSSNTPENMARQYLQENATLLKLQSSDLSDLEYSFLHDGPAGPTVRFNQVVNGIPVYKAVIAVHINNHNMITYVANDYKSNISLNSFAPDITASQARSSALSYLGIQGNLQVDKTELVIYQVQNQTYLAYLVRIMANSLIGDWEVMIDAHTGEFLKVFDTSYSYNDPGAHGANTQLTDVNQPPLINSIPVTGTGTVFDPDPLSSAQATYGDPGFTDGNDADTPQLNGELMTVNLLEIDLTAGTYSLVGPYAEIVDTEGPFNGLYSQASPTFNFNRFDDAFEAVNTYYHIDSSMRYINETLGVPISPIQYNGGARYDPHGLNGADNSHYTSSNGVVAFGEGGVDDAEDSDVIHHELGHALHDWVTNGNLSQVNGLSEGSGDYWAQSYNRSLGNWTPADPPYHWVFNWDGHNPFWNGRVTNYPALYPGGLTGQIHTDGQIWSTCNMKVYDAIGRTKLDTAFWEGLGMTNSSTNQEQAANAVYQAAIDLGYPVSDLQQIHDIYGTCVYIVPDVPIPDFSITADPPTQDVCIPNDAIYNVNVGSILGYNQNVNLTSNGHPAGTTATFSPNNQAAPYSSTLTIGNTSAAMAGSYNIDIVGAGPTSTHTTTVQLNLCAPLIDVTPESLSSAQFPDTQTVQALTISNDGTSDLEWDIYEDGTSSFGGSWADDFDSYATGSQMHGQGGWKGWDNSSAFGALTSDVQALSAPNSVDIMGNSDLVHEYSGYTSGQWIYTAWQYIPSNMTGLSYFILLNHYNDGGPYNWSATVSFDGSTGMMTDFTGGATLPYTADAWKEIRVEIDLDADTQSFYYDGQLLYSAVWAGYNGGTGPATMEIAAVDLYANGATSVYYDNMSLARPAATCDGPDPIDWLSTSPISGTVAAMSSTDVDVTFDSTGYAAGVYTGTLCVNSNDPLNPVVSVPLTMTVLQNSVPVAVADAYTTTQNTAVSISAPGVLTNDSDGDGHSLTAVLDSDVSSGTLSLDPDGSFTYTPTAGFEGDDMFTYYAHDGLDDSNVVTVTIAVLNTAPVAVSDSYTTTQDTMLSVAAPGVLLNDSDVDGDGLTAVLDSDVMSGTLTLNADGSFDYMPDAGFVGEDSFTYHAHDGTEASNSVTVTISVTEDLHIIFLPFVTQD